MIENSNFNSQIIFINKMSIIQNKTLKIKINLFNFDQLSCHTFYIGILFLIPLPVSALFLLTIIVFIIKNNLKRI